MNPEGQNPEQKELADEIQELDDGRLDEVAGGAASYEDPREKDPGKKDDPKEW